MERYPRSAAYDPQWVVDNLMGPPTVVGEALMHVMPLQPDMRVLERRPGRPAQLTVVTAPA
jgi:hypothetical protein